MIERRPHVCIAFAGYRVTTVTGNLGQRPEDAAADPRPRAPPGEGSGGQGEEVRDLRHVLPGVRFAVDAYLRFVRDAEWHDGICSSLTELFAPKIHRQRLENWPRDYPWIESAGLGYFRQRVSQANRDVEHGLAVTLDWFDTVERQRRALDIVQLKLDVLWSMLDAMYMAYVLKMPPYFNEREAT